MRERSAFMVLLRSPTVAGVVHAPRVYIRAALSIKKQSQSTLALGADSHGRGFFTEFLNSHTFFV